MAQHPLPSGAVPSGWKVPNSKLHMINGHVVGTEKRLSRSCLVGGRFFLYTWRNSIFWMGAEPSIEHLPGKFRLFFSRHIDHLGK